MHELTSDLPAWAPYAAAGTGSGVLGAAITWIGTRRARRRTRPPSRPRTASRTEDTLTFTVAAIVAGICAQGMAHFLRDKLGFALPVVIAIGGILELVAFTCALRARRSLRDTGSAGLDGIAVWGVAAASGVFSALDSGDLVTGVFRVFLALLAAWLWERGMAIERRARRRLRLDEDRITWKVSFEWIVCSLGLAVPRTRTLAEADTDRWITRLATATARLDDLRERRWRLLGAARRAEARKRKAMRGALQHTDLAHNPQTQARALAETAALSQAASYRAAQHAFWVPAPSAHDPRPRICSGRHAGPGLVALRLHERGRERRTLHPAPPQRESSTTTTLLARIQERRTDRRLGVRPVSALHSRTDEPRMDEARLDEPRTPPLPAPRTADSHHPELLRTPHPADPHREDAPHTPVPAYPHTPPRTEAGPARTDHTPEPPHTRTDPHARIPAPAPPTPAHQPAPAQAPTPDRPHTDPRTRVTPIGGAATRAEWTARIADEIRTAHAEGREWEPDYDDLMTRTGFKRRWCEARVAEARALAARTDRAEPARSREPHADADDPERADRTGTTG